MTRSLWCVTAGSCNKSVANTCSPIAVQHAGNQARHICDRKAGPLQIVSDGNTGNRTRIRRGVECAIAIAEFVARAIWVGVDADHLR